MENLDIYELMEVKGGVADASNVCIFSPAVVIRCDVAGSGAIEKPQENTDK